MSKDRRVFKPLVTHSKLITTYIFCEKKAIHFYINIVSSSTGPDTIETSATSATIATSAAKTSSSTSFSSTVSSMPSTLPATSFSSTVSSTPSTLPATLPATSFSSTVSSTPSTLPAASFSSTVSSMTSTLSSTSPSLPSSDPALAVGLGVGLGVVFVLMATAVALALYFLFYRKRKIVETPEMLIEHPVRFQRPVKISQLLDYLSERRRDKSIYSEEFKSLPPTLPPRIKSCSYAEKFRSKNRFVDILPYNENRVRLKSSDVDYINASFVDGYDKAKAYVATQGPLNSTCYDFWCMVWEQNSSKIIMVANLIEDGKSKCAQYFPMLGGNKEFPAPMTFNNFVISLSSEEEHADYSVRTLKVVKEKETRIVRQFHYTRWPDQGVPESSSSIIRFYNACFSGENYSAPIIIHCSAGVGRTGTLLAIDILLAQSNREGQIDVALSVDKLRRNRNAMVQTLAQYLFLHYTIAEALLVGDVSVPALGFSSYFSTLENSKTCNKSDLQLQFELLEISKPVFTEKNYSYGLDNKHLNRFSKVLPVDEFRAFLNSKENETYINAVFVDSHETKHRFIVTQAPLQTNVENFWELVLDYNCLIIFMLNGIIPAEDNYWPNDGCSKTFGDLIVNNLQEIEKDNMVLSELKISKRVSNQNGVLQEKAEFDDSSTFNYLSVNPRETNVKHIRISNWPDGEILADRKNTLLSMVGEAFDCIEKNPDATLLVHCMNGSERSGLFCALFCVLEKLRITGEVDVFNSVKKVQKTRPEFFSTTELLRNLYEIVDSYLARGQPQ